MAIESTLIGNGPRSEDRRTARQPDTRDGVIGSFFTLSLGMIESGVRTTASIGRTMTTESQRVGEAVIVLNEQGSQALLRTARKLNESAFGLLTDVVNHLESAALVVIAQGQATSDRVAELAAQASQVAVGSRGLNGTAHP